MSFFLDHCFINPLNAASVMLVTAHSDHFKEFQVHSHSVVTESDDVWVFELFT